MFHSERRLSFSKASLGEKAPFDVLIGERSADAFKQGEFLLKVDIPNLDLDTPETCR